MDPLSPYTGSSDYTRAPVYSPFQNPAHADDMFGYLANMYGPMLVEGFAGPDAFLAHQMPSQALSDQYSSARYQRQNVQNISAANARGTEQVANKIIGIQSLLNGGQEVTQLDRENADAMASVINNPVMKQIAGQLIGPENLEGLMFGRRGDPTATAASVNRMGYYRQDATGNRRMSAESSEQFSSELYENMFGDSANINEMRGFGAVAAGELTEGLFQRGKLPKSMGAMSAADRVNLMSSSQRDEETMNRLADQYAHQDLMERDADYAMATKQEQKLMRADKMGEYRGTLDETFKEIDKFQAGEKGAKSAEEIEQLDGYGVAANAVDAQRTSKTVKEYAGAVAAVRDIFGASGRGDAPMQELLAALEQLSGGSMMNMSAGKMQQLMTGLSITARETGRDISALSAGMQDSMNIGSQYGLRSSTIMAGEAERLHTVQALSDAGVFEHSAFGKLNKGELERAQKERSIRGDASGVGRMLASMNRLVTENAEMYEGTKMEAAMKAYQKGETTFEYEGETINLAELAGREGVQGLRALAEESGAEQSHIFAYMNDKSTDEYMKEGYAYKAQGYELQRNVSRRNESRMREAMSSDEFKAAAKPRGMSDDDFREQTNRLARGLSYKMTGIIMDETDGMSVDERNAHIEKRTKEELVDYFKSSAGGEMNQRQAEAESEKYFNAMYGEDPKERKANLNAMYAEVSGAAQKRTGENIEAAKQLYNKEGQQVATERVQQAARRAERQTELTKAMGTESTIAQRMGEELDAMANGDDMSLERLFNITSKDAMQQQYAPEMQEGLMAASKMYGEAIVTPDKIRELSEQAAKAPNGPEARQLKKMAGFAENQKLNEEEQASLVDRATRRSAYQAAGSTEEEREQNEETMRRANMLFKAFNTGEQDDVEAASRAMAKEMLGPNAADEKIAAFSAAMLSGDEKLLDKEMGGGFFGGGLTDEQKERTRAISTALRDSREMGGLEKAGFAVQAKESLAAQDRPAAQLYDYKKAVNTRVRDDVADGLDTRAFKRLKPADMSPEAFAAQSREIGDMASRALTSIVADEMGGADEMAPEDRAKYMATRAKEKMTEYFAQNDAGDGTPREKAERAKEKAEKHFGAMFGSNSMFESDESAIQRNMEKMYEHGQDVAKERGLSLETAASRRRPPADSSVAEMAAREAVPRTYDRQKLGVPEEMTAEQQKLVAELEKDPEGRDFESAMQDSEKRQTLLTLPDKDAVALFNKMTPEAQQRGVDGMRKFKHSWKRNFLPQDQQQNMDRIYDAITSQDSGGMSSNNVSTSDIAQIDYNDPVMMGTGGDPIGDVAARDALKTIGGEAEPFGVFSPFDEGGDDVTTRSIALSRASLKSSDASAARTMSAMRTNSPASISSLTQAGGGDKESKVNVSGTLVMQGLSQAVLAATGSRMEDTPDGGVPVGMSNGQGAYIG